MSTNLSPLIRATGITAAHDPRVLDHGDLSVKMLFEAGNNCTWDTLSNKEKVFLDGESSWATLSIRYGLTRNSEVGLLIGYTEHSPGHSDRFIHWWHAFMHLPQGRRNSIEKNKLRYVFLPEKSQGVNLQSKVQGVSNLSLYYGWQILNTRYTTLAFLISSGLPTGRSDQLLGMDTPSFSSELAGSMVIDYRGARLTIFGNFATNLPGVINDLRRSQRPVVLSGTLGAGFSIIRHLYLQGQFDFNSPVFRGVLDQTGKWAGQTVIGFTFKVTTITSLKFAITEDTVVSSSADVGFLFSLEHALSGIGSR